MKPRIAPQRLGRQAALRDLFDAARRSGPDEGRLERIGQRVRERIEALPERGAVGRFVDGLVAGRRLAPAAAAVLIALLATGVGAAIWLALRQPARVPAPRAPEGSRSVQPTGLPAPPWGPDEAPALPAPRPRLPGGDATHPRPVAQVQPLSPDKPPAASDLPEQLRLYRQAQAAARTGRHDQALGLLDALEQRFPGTPLAAEIGLSRAEWLYAAGRLARADRVIRDLLARPELAGKRAELTHLLADVQARQGRCDLAVESYRRALGLGLSPERAAAARAGLLRCSQR